MKVRLAFLQTAIMLPSIKTTESTLSQEKCKGIQMELVPGFLKIQIKKDIAMVPLTNVKIAYLESDDGVEIMEKRKPGRPASQPDA